MKQKTIKGCSWVLFCGAITALLLAVLMAVFTAQIGEDETLNLIIDTAMSKATEKELPYKPVVIVGALGIGLTVIGICFACCTKVTMHCICVTLTMVILLALSVVLIVFGSILAVPGAGGKEYIDKNCKFVQTGNTEIDQYSK